MQPINKYNRKERIGHLRSRVVIQSYTEAVNSFGERAKTWANAATVWGKVEIMLTQAETESAGQETSLVSAKFTIRKRSLNERNRISFNNQLYDIQSISESDCRQYLTIMGKRIKE
jgi:SPP1 family predicted phage head-tail adaptor